MGQSGSVFDAKVWRAVLGPQSSVFDDMELCRYKNTINFKIANYSSINVKNIRNYLHLS